MLATPVRSAVHLSLRIQVDILHNELEELFESGTINDVTNVFLILDSSTILVSIQCPLDGIPVTRSKDLGKGKSAVTSV